LNKKKDEIISAAIDLFAEHGVGNVSLEMIAEMAVVKRPNIYYYYKGGKDDIIGDVINIFDGMIKKKVLTIMERTAEETCAEGILSSLFMAFDTAESEMGRKLNRIMFSSYVDDMRINTYLQKTFYKNREDRFSCIFESLVGSGRAKPFDTHSAARMLNKIFIASALEDTLTYPFESNEPPQCLDCLNKDCLNIINKILDGTF
jgi:AcrR family transcriptional regulator